MSTASAVPAVIDYLVTQSQASASLGAASPPVLVVDGPNVTQDVMANQRILWVGYDLLAASQDSAESSENWPILDFAKTEDEDGAVTCTAQFWTGDTTMKTSRDGCEAIVGAVAGLLRGYPSQGGPGDTTMGGLVFWSRLAAARWSQQQTSSGSQCACVFTVAFRARLTG